MKCVIISCILPANNVVYEIGGGGCDEKYNGDESKCIEMIVFKHNIDYKKNYKSKDW